MPLGRGVSDVQCAGHHGQIIAGIPRADDQPLGEGAAVLADATKDCVPPLFVHHHLSRVLPLARGGGSLRSHGIRVPLGHDCQRNCSAKFLQLCLQSLPPVGVPSNSTMGTSLQNELARI